MSIEINQIDEPTKIIIDKPIFKRKSKRDNLDDGEYENDNNEDDQIRKSSFKRHFNDSKSQNILKSSELVDTNKWIPSIDNECPLDKEKIIGGIPLCLHLEKDGLKNIHLLEDANTLEDIGIKSQLKNPFLKYQLQVLNKENLTNGPLLDDSNSSSHCFTPLQWELYKYTSEYQDLLYPNLSFNNSQELINIYSLHVLNHLMKTRDTIIRNTDKINAKEPSAASSKNNNVSNNNKKMKLSENNESSIRDQGFTRPKVLILVPFRSSAVDIINTICKISGSTHVDGMDKFEEGFSVEEDAMDEKKPQDFKWLFKGNIDDCFKIGIKFMKKKMKLFSPFYTSDIIVASPLGLKLVIGNEEDKKQDYDFLSSIEITWLHNADVFQMQNWEHIRAIFEHLNLKPKESHDCDFSRIKSYYLDEKSKYVRQNIINSQMITPEIMNLFNNQCNNIAGKIKINVQYKSELSKTLTVTKQKGISQIFNRIPGDNIVDSDEKRFQYFIKQVLPQLNNSHNKQKGIFIYIPSYFDFVRVRNYLKDNKYDFMSLSEYTPTSEISRARGEFFHGKLTFLLCTERFHFFRRYKIRGIKQMVFYSLPEYSQFYSEFVEMVCNTYTNNNNNNNNIPSTDHTIQIVSHFMTLDKLKLERIMGSKRVEKMLSSLKDSFIFV